MRGLVERPGRGYRDGIAFTIGLEPPNAVPVPGRDGEGYLKYPYPDREAVTGRDEAARDSLAIDECSDGGTQVTNLQVTIDKDNLAVRRLHPAVRNTDVRPVAPPNDDGKAIESDLNDRRPRIDRGQLQPNWLEASLVFHNHWIAPQESTKFGSLAISLMKGGPKQTPANTSRTKVAAFSDNLRVGPSHQIFKLRWEKFPAGPKQEPEAAPRVVGFCNLTPMVVVVTLSSDNTSAKGGPCGLRGPAYPLSRPLVAVVGSLLVRLLEKGSSMAIRSKGHTSSLEVTILLVDDHPIVRAGYSRLIAAQSLWRVCGEAKNQMEALERIGRLAPQLAIVDITLSDGSGVELIRQISRDFPNVKTLVVSAHNEKLMAERVLTAGAMGYINKLESPEKLVEGIHRVLAGEVYLSEAMTRQILMGRVGAVSQAQRPADPVAQLTNRELEIFELLGKGMNTKKIAAMLFISPKAVHGYRATIKRKLGLANSTELIQRATQWTLEQGD